MFEKIRKYEVGELFIFLLMTILNYLVECIKYQEFARKPGLVIFLVSLLVLIFWRILVHKEIKIKEKKIEIWEKKQYEKSLRRIIRLKKCSYFIILYCIVLIQNIPELGVKVSILSILGGTIGALVFVKLLELWSNQHKDSLEEDE